MRWVTGLSLAAWGALTALGLALTAWLRRDARQDERREAKIKDKERAHEIADRIDRSLDDPDRVSANAKRGFRD